MKRYKRAHWVALASPISYIFTLNTSINRSKADAAIITIMLVAFTYGAFYIYYMLVDAGVIRSWAKNIEKYQNQEPKELKGSNLNYFNRNYFDYNQKSNFTITQVLLISALFFFSAMSFLYFLSMK